MLVCLCRGGSAHTHTHMQGGWTTYKGQGLFLTSILRALAPPSVARYSPSLYEITSTCGERTAGHNVGSRASIHCIRIHF